MQIKNDDNLVNIEELPNRFRQSTSLVLDKLMSASSLSSKDARNELVGEWSPFNERLSKYASEHFRIEDNVKQVKKHLRNGAKAKGFEFAHAILSQWLTSPKQEVYLSTENIFKLCLSMSLDIEESAHFVHNCLYRSWFNYRVRRETIYLFFLGKQDLFGEDIWKAVDSFISDDESISAQSQPEYLTNCLSGTTGYTKVIGSSIKQSVSIPHSDKESALSSLTELLKENRSHFTGIQKSGIKTYQLYLKEGGIGIKSLLSLFNEETGYTLPATSYLETSYYSDHDLFMNEDKIKSHRLLWGADNRKAWLESNKSDFDLLHTNEIKIEEHDVGKLSRFGVPRGNMICVLFFHFYYENIQHFRQTNQKISLFDRFYEFTNRTLVDECGMMPLHPRKPFDNLFLKSMAHYDESNPADYLNKILMKFYR